MGNLMKTNPDVHEPVTEIFDLPLWQKSLGLIVEFLRAKGVQEVRVEFGYVLDRDLAGKQQPSDRLVGLNDLERLIEAGLADGTIEWKRSSDFLFYPAGLELAFKLCNDADLHFASANSSLLMEFPHQLRRSGVRVYDSGRLI